MIQQRLSIPPTAPDVRSSDESNTNISPNVPEYDGKSEGQRQAREKRNKLKEGHRRHAKQQKEAHDTYKMELDEYYKRRLEKEVEERRAARVREALYDKIQEALEELKAISHPNEEQEQLLEVLQTTALRAQAEGLIPSFPLGQHRTNRTCKVKEDLPSKD
jgi:hypothetical protein